MELISLENISIDKIIEINDKINNIKNKLLNNSLLQVNLDLDFINIYTNDTNYINDTNRQNNRKNDMYNIKNINIYLKKNKRLDITQSFEISCPVCYDSFLYNNIKKLNCLHILCKKCFIKWSDTCNKNLISINCPMCRKNIN
jgi:hypothetical protein